jgi:hypothetical protein
LKQTIIKEIKMIVADPGDVNVLELAREVMAEQDLAANLMALRSEIDPASDTDEAKILQAAQKIACLSITPEGKFTRKYVDRRGEDCIRVVDVRDVWLACGAFRKSLRVRREHKQEEARGQRTALV